MRVREDKGGVKSVVEKQQRVLRSWTPVLNGIYALLHEGSRRVR